MGADAGSCLILSEEGVLSAVGAGAALPVVRTSGAGDTADEDVDERAVVFASAVSTDVGAVGCFGADAEAGSSDAGASLATVAEGAGTAGDELADAACVDGSSNVKSVSKGAAAAGLATLVCAKPVLAKPVVAKTLSGPNVSRRKPVKWSSISSSMDCNCSNVCADGMSVMSPMADSISCAMAPNCMAPARRAPPLKVCSRRWASARAPALSGRAIHCRVTAWS